MGMTSIGMVAEVMEMQALSQEKAYKMKQAQIKISTGDTKMQCSGRGQE